MKKLINISLSIALLLSVGCQEQMEYDLPVDVAWTSYSSTTSNEVSEGDLKVSTGGYIFLRDASQGTLTHEWIIDDNADFFSDIQDPTSKIEGKSTTSQDAYIVFNKSGRSTITLRNTYPNKVVSNTSPRIESVFDNSIGAWVFTKTFEVEAYGKLKPGFTVYSLALDGTQSELFSIAGDKETSQSDLRDITILQGEKLKFVYDTASEYKSDNQSYTVPAVAEAEGGDASSGIFTFNSITEPGEPYTGFSITATREEIAVDKGNGVIPAAITKKVIPISLTVKYAPIAAILSGVRQGADGKIMLSFNKELASVPAGIENNFKIYKDGTELAINSVELYEGSSLLLTVEQSDIANLNNYEPSEATLSYTSTAGNELYAAEDSAMEYAVEDFNDINIALYDILNPDYFDFKLAPDSSTEIAGGWWASYTTATPSTSNSSISFVESFEGQESVICYDVKSSVKNNAKEQLILQLSEKLESESICPAGDYTLRCKVYIESATGSKATLGLIFGNWISIHTLDLTAQATGCWIDYSAPFTTTSQGTVSSFKIQVKQDFFSDDASAKFYIDDVYIYKR